MHDDPLDAVRAAERRGGGGHVARVDAGADVGGGERHAVVAVMQVHALDAEPEPRAELGEQRDVARGLVPEA